MADRIAEAPPRDPRAVRQVMARFEEIGVDELIFDPTMADLAQVDHLAEFAL